VDGKEATNEADNSTGVATVEGTKLNVYDTAVGDEAGVK
jgi:hypothetical protein